MRPLRYLKSLVKVDTGNSSKSFALVLSSLMTFIAGMVICGILAYDAYCNSYIKTDLEKVGIFMLCMSAATPLSGVPKIFGEKYFNKMSAKYGDKEEDEAYEP